MTTFNGVTVIQRGNRPSPIVPAKLDFLNYVAGELSDPFQVCSVHVFPNTAFGTASPYVNQTPGDTDYGLVSSVNTSIVFHNYKRDAGGSKTGFDANVSACAAETSYTGDLRYSASSIFGGGDNDRTGHFSVILQPSGAYWPVSASPTWDPLYNNTASAVGEYIDIWTVVQAEGSRAQIYVNTFGMNTANTFAVTEPLEVTTSNKLAQRYVQVGSTKRLQIQTELIVDNKPIKKSLQNLIESGTLISNPQISITKLNESPNLTTRVQVTGEDGEGGFTSAGVSVDSQGTISYLWDTTAITPFYTGEVLGGEVGVYEISVKYDVAGETIISPRFKLIAR